MGAVKVTDLKLGVSKLDKNINLYGTLVEAT